MKSEPRSRSGASAKEARAMPEATPPNPAPPQPTRPSPRNNGGGSALDRELPHALDAERALLGSMLLDAGAVSEAIASLADAGVDAFWYEKHARVYSLLVSL